MGLSERQRYLLHLVVRRYDHQIKVAYIDPVTVEEETGFGLSDLAGDMDELEAQGYVERKEPAEGTEDGWAVAPTDKGVMTAMGLGE
jgi:hypothetical protein